MRTYKLTIAYDGTNYQGWQRQSDTDRTIQGILEETLENCTGYQVQIDGSGRTDAGVHASGQTASVVLPGKVDTALFTEKMNGCLPPDIRILDVELVKNGFHARKSAVGKVYEYRIDTGIKQDVFTRKYSGHFPGEPDLARMREAAGYLTGTHFFAGYTDKKDNRSVRRTIYSIMIRDERKDFLPCGKSDQIGNGNCIVIRYDGTGFLYHMVRILTGTLLEVGMRERTAESVKEALLTWRQIKRRGFWLRQADFFDEKYGMNEKRGTGSESICPFMLYPETGSIRVILILCERGG